MATAFFFDFSPRKGRQHKSEIAAWSKTVGAIGQQRFDLLNAKAMASIGGLELPEPRHGVGAPAVRESGSAGPLDRGGSHYSVILNKEFDGGHVGLGNMNMGLPYGGATISGNWGFTYNEGEKAGKEYIARFTFVLDQNGYIQTLHSDFVPGTKTPYPVPTGK